MHKTAFIKMETFFMNTKNSKTSEPHTLISFKNYEYRVFRNRSMVYGSKQ